MFPLVFAAIPGRPQPGFEIIRGTMVSTAIALAVPLTAGAAESGSPQPFAPHFEFSFCAGPADDDGFQQPVLASMIQGHLDRPEVIDEYRTYPTVEGGAAGGVIALERHFTPWLSIAAEGGIHTFGAARGHSSSFFDHFVDVKAASQSLAMLVRFGRVVHIAAGPSIEFVDVETRRTSVGATEPTLEDHVREQKFGMVVDVSARVPQNSRAFISMGWQYRWSGSIEFGPYDLTAYQDDAVMPRTTIELDRSTVLFGFGARFR